MPDVSIVTKACSQNEIMETWMRYLEKHLEFPFEAEINESQEGGFLKMGDRLKISGIKDYDDFYGVIVSVTYKAGKYSLPLCDLEAVGGNSQNFTPVDDYSVRYANRYNEM